MNYAELIKANIILMKALFATAKNEKRGMSDTEKTEYNTLENQISEWENCIEIENKLAGHENKLTTVVNQVTVVDPTNQSDGKKFSCLGDFFMAVKAAGISKNQNVDERLVNLGTGLNTQVGADGGFLIAPEFVETLLQSASEESVLYKSIRMLQIGAKSNSINMPALDEKSRADGARFGGVVAGWTDEGGTFNKSKPKFRNVQLKLAKLLAFCYLTEEMIEDAAAMESWIVSIFGEEVAFELDDAIINGTGKGQPLGFLKSDALVTVAKEAAQAAKTIVFKNVNKMRARLSPKSMKTAIWLISQDAIEQLPLMNLDVGTGGVSVYMPAGGASEKPYDTLFGRPVIPIEQCATLGTVGDIILCDMKDYIGIQKKGMQVDKSMHVEFLNDEQVFRFRYRFNGTPYTKNALVSRNNANFKTSPYVALATRG